MKAQLERMVRLNRTRADYLEKFEALINAYNSGSRNIEEIFRDLLALGHTLTEEQTRHVREQLSEAELTIFDILTRPGPKLSTEERELIKKIARQLLDRLNTILVLDWRRRAAARAQVQIAIEDTLDTGLPESYSKALYESKCAALFEHVFESYVGDGASVYTVGYLPLNVRLALASQAEEENGEAAQLALLCIDPVAFLDSNGGADSVDEIMLVTGGERSSDSDPDSKGANFSPDEGRNERESSDWLDENYPSAGNRTLGAGRRRLSILHHSVPLKPVQGYWEFIFFNKTLPTGRPPASGQSLSHVQKEVQAIIAKYNLAGGGGSAPVAGWLAALRACYAKHFGKSSVRKNNISLCLLSTPSLGGHFQACRIFDLPKSSVPGAQALAPVSDKNGGTLLTGDIFLTPKVRDQMMAHFGKTKWGQIHVMQVPHHGSRHSWRPGLAKGCPHSVSVFCVPDSDPTGKHPHRSVLKDLDGTTFMFANYSQAVIHTFHFAA